MSRTLVLTLGDAHYQEITELTFPRAKAYADSIGADFQVLSSRVYPGVHMGYEKFQARGLLDRYSRILLLDGDVLVRPGTPDLFQMVPFGSVGAMDELGHMTHWTEEMLAIQIRPYRWRGRWTWGQFNSGVLVFDETHKKVFENPVITNLPLWDQPCLNVAVRKLGLPFTSLSPEYNFLVFHRYANYDQLRRRAHLLHFSGVPLSERVAELRAELGMAARGPHAPEGSDRGANDPVRSEAFSDGPPG
jgi:lipopolysaccharide biosynthesis glycosyltransferase